MVSSWQRAACKSAAGVCVRARGRARVCMLARVLARAFVCVVRVCALCGVE
jgi:hypothetical protein